MVYFSAKETMMEELNQPQGFRENARRVFDATSVAAIMVGGILAVESTFGAAVDSSHRPEYVTATAIGMSMAVGGLVARRLFDRS